MLLKKPFRFVKRAFKNLYFLTFLNGFLLASLCYFKMEASYETGLFLSIKNDIDNKIDADDTQDSIVVKAMHTCNFLMGNRAFMFRDAKAMASTKADFFQATSVDLMTTKGACGSYSTVLARILKTFHYPIRIAQMKAAGIYAAHNLVEVETGNGWVVLDPTYDLCFVRPDNHLASFQDVENDWPYYSKQVPKDYDFTYHYEGVRYSNWTKVPILFPAIKGALNFFLGTQRADTISIRSYLLDVYDISFYVTLCLYLPLFLSTFSSFVKTKIFPERDIPLTFRNFMKYLRSRVFNVPLNRIQSS
jgi:hypothetical protein